MPVKNVELIPGYFYHIYNRAVEGALLFREWKNYEFFLEKVTKYLLSEADILAYCLMPNHYHFLIKITNQYFSKAMHKLALSYVVAYNIMYNRRGRLFSSPYQRIHVTDLNYLLHLSRYIHLNPVKAQLVQKAEMWDYSSYQEYVGVRESEYINTGEILDLLTDKPGASVNIKQQEYQNFVELWEFEYMEFKMRR